MTVNSNRRVRLRVAEDFIAGLFGKCLWGAICIFAEELARFQDQNNLLAKYGQIIYCSSVSTMNVMTFTPTIRAYRTPL